MPPIPRIGSFLFKVNLITTLNMCRAVVPAMRAAGRGSIVTIGAAAALGRGKGMAAYAASKSAVLRLTESLADELKAHGVRANCVLPSTIDTPQNRARHAQGRHQPLGDARRRSPRWSRSCSSDAAAGVNGAAVPVTGRG